MTPFSVNICVYHKDDAVFFREAVKSVTAFQTVRPAEVIIVADGPIYGDLNAAVEEFERDTALFKVVRLPENRGHAGARQAGLEAASNDLVAIMDADDISAPDRFEKQLAAFASERDAAVVGGQITEFVDTPDNIVGSRIVPADDAGIRQYLKSRCPMNLVTVMYRKSAVSAVGGFKDWYCEEDYYLWIRMAEAGCRFANLPDTLVNVRVGKEMYRRRGGWRYFRSEARLQSYMLSHRLISLPRYLYNVAGRFAVQVAMPNRLRGFIFQKLFRK